MMKWIMYLVLAALVFGSWQLYSNKSKELEKIKHTVTELRGIGDPNDDEKVAKMQADLDSRENELTFTGILVTFLAAGLAGIFVVVTLLPFFAQRVTHAIYDSGEMVEKDVMHDARSLLAQGNYLGAIEAFKVAAAADPLNRLPWVEIAKIYKDNLEDPAAAVATIRHALESQEWEVNDAAYFLFRLAELYNEVNEDRASAVAIMNQVVEQFPGTRHSANAKTKLHEWEAEDAIAAAGGDVAANAARAARTAQSLADEEAEFLARMKRPGDDGNS